MKHSPHLARLIDALRTLPGVGPKTAQRMAFHLLQEGRPGARALAEALARARSSCVRRCQRCRMLTEERAVRRSARPAQRDAALLCVVESPADVVAIESSGSYRGRYFVLMGHLSPLDGIGPEQLGVRELEAILAEGGVRELILATNSTVEGEATAHFLSELASAARHPREPHRPRRAGGRGAGVRRRRHARARARRPPVAVSRPSGPSSTATPAVTTRSRVPRSVRRSAYRITVRSSSSTRRRQLTSSSRAGTGRSVPTPR